MFIDSEKPLAVVTTITPWDEPPRIRHQITRQLLKKYNVLYVQLNQKINKNRKTCYAENSLLIWSTGITFRGIGLIFKTFPSIENHYNNHISTSIIKKIKDLGYTEATLINFQFDFHHICESNIFSKKVFILNDDFIGMRKNLTENAKFLLQEKQRKVIQYSDLCYGLSQPLVDELSIYTKKVKLIIPGAELFENKESIDPPNKEKKEINVAFMGYIDNRIKTDWLIYILKNKLINLLLIGPVSKSFPRHEFNDLDNCQFIDPITGKELSRKLASQDVLIMPYDVEQTNIQKTSSPNKFFQYMAAGRPTVISDMPNFIEAPKGFIYKAKDKESFLNLIIEAKFNDTISLRTSRVNYAKTNSWEIRGQDFLNDIDQI